MENTNKRFSIKYSDGSYSEFSNIKLGARQANGIPLGPDNREVFKTMVHCNMKKWNTADKEYRIY